MKYREFSDLGWRVSEVGLGCWQIGWCWGDVEDKDARKILKKVAGKNVNIIYLKESDHRLSTETDLKMITQSIEYIRKTK